MLCIFFGLQYLWLWLKLSRLPYYPAFHRKHYTTKPKETTRFYRCQPKPEWVKKEVVRLKAFMPNGSYRDIAATFNRLHHHKKRMTVGKTFVGYTIQRHSSEIILLRKKIKRRKPRHLSKNTLWALDLTQVKDENNQLHQTFGVIDAGTRACLYLTTIKDKSSVTLLRRLLDMIEQYGKPKAIRTDNERCFTSVLFRFGLWLLNINHQTTQVCCPWQNGRIERLFGTLKCKLKAIVMHQGQIDVNLALFRQWYNHIRPHQNLHYQTPADVWNQQKPNTRGKAVFFSQWFGALSGFYFPPD